jgi:hypothetical protein
MMFMAKEKNNVMKLRFKGAIALALIAMISLSTLAAAQQFSGGTMFVFQQYTLPILPTTWISIAIAAVLTVIAIAAIVYMLSGILDSPNARAWARLQIYQGILSILLAVIFLSFVYFFLLNPQPALKAVNLLPMTTQFTSEMDCSTAFDMFSIATCDVAVFNHFAFGLFETVYFVTTTLGFTPGINGAIALKIENLQFSTGAGLPSFVPFSAETQLSVLFSGLLILVLLNQIQALILSGSLLWLAFFVSIGLVARAFGFSRTFGGAMIAMGLGLGLVYPLVVTISYGFINVAITNSPDASTGALAIDMFGALIYLVFGQGAASGEWLFPLGAAIAGLTFLPFLNFTIVDSFIVDFSSAIGERINFMSLLIGLV